MRNAWLIKRSFQPSVFLTFFFRRVAFALQKVVRLGGMLLLHLTEGAWMKSRYLVSTLISSVVAIFVLSTVAPAAAADLNPAYKSPAIAPAYNWSGFYVGLDGGGASSHECLTVTSVAGTPVFPTSEGCHDATGGVAGGQVGYRWQATNWVFGVEAQGDWADLKGSNASLTAIAPYINETKINAIGLFTGQVGYAWNNALWYMKGGGAVTDNKYSSIFTGGAAAFGLPPGVVWNQATETRWGGAVGTGLEFGFAPNWSVAVEYDHLFMGTNSVTFPPMMISPSLGAVGRSDNISQDVDMGTVRVNYRF
jgi:outer membrane immunogenic protein